MHFTQPHPILHLKIFHLPRVSPSSRHTVLQQFACQGLVIARCRSSFILMLPLHILFIYVCCLIYEIFNLGLHLKSLPSSPNLQPYFSQTYFPCGINSWSQSSAKMKWKPLLEHILNDPKIASENYEFLVENNL